MHARAAAAVGLSMLLAACGGASSPPSGSSPARLGCGGWFEVSHDVLTAEVQLTGPVHAVAVNALLDDGTTQGTATPLSVSPGSSHRTVRVRGVGGNVVSAKARVVGASDGVQATCDLSSPH